MAQYSIGLLIGLLVGYWMGWIGAHQTVKTECRRLGGFYVGDSVFKCEEVPKPEGNPKAPPNPHRAPESDKQ